jgi:hypothetical protein
MGAMAPGMNIGIPKNNKIQSKMILSYRICVGLSSSDGKVFVEIYICCCVDSEQTKHFLEKQY